MKKKIKICFFVGSFRAGGAEKHVLDIIENLDKDKYLPYLCVLSKTGIFLDRFNQLNVKIHEFNHNKFNLIKLIYNLFRYVVFLRKENIDILHVHLVYCYWFSLFGAKLANVKNKVITWHNIYTPLFKSKKVISRVHYGNINSSKIIAVSEKVKKENCKFYNVDYKKVRVVYNGIDSKEFSVKSNLSSNTKSNDYKIGVIGSLIQQKGHIYLLKAIKNLKLTIPNLKLFVIGDGPLNHELSNYVVKNNLSENVCFLGRREDIPKLLKTLDLWIMPSLFEGFSIALLEAMATGLPIIATNVGGNAEAIINNESGLIIRDQDINDITESITFSYNNRLKLDEMGTNARDRFVNCFTIENMISNLDSLYTENLNNR